MPRDQTRHRKGEVMSARSIFGAGAVSLWLLLAALGPTTLWAQDEPAPTTDAPAAATTGSEPAIEAAKAPPPEPELSQFQVRQQNRKRMEDAVKQLIAEARELDKLEDIKVPAVFKRPHPMLSDWGSEMSVDTLSRMLQSFTGNDYRDTYIRWHLMHVVKLMAAEDRAEAGRRLVRLVQRLPPPINVPFKQEYRHEPPEIAAEYHRLHASTHVAVGYPPFVRDYYGRASIPYVDAARAAKIEEALKKMEELRGQFQTIRYPEAVAFNNRVRQVNWIIRQYRGEVIYAMLQTGDPAMVKLVTAEIERQVRQKQRVAFDLMAFVYAALFDGVLDLYDTKTLMALGNDLRRIGASADSYILYMVGDREPPSYSPNRIRNFADYVYHMVYTLKELENVTEGTLIPETPEGGGGAQTN